MQLALLGWHRFLLGTESAGKGTAQVTATLHRQLSPQGLPWAVQGSREWAGDDRTCFNPRGNPNVQF